MDYHHQRLIDMNAKDFGALVQACQGIRFIPEILEKRVRMVYIRTLQNIISNKTCEDLWKKMFLLPTVLLVYNSQDAKSIKINLEKFSIRVWCCMDLHSEGLHPAQTQTSCTWHWWRRSTWSWSWASLSSSVWCHEGRKPQQSLRDADLRQWYRTSWPSVKGAPWKKPSTLPRSSGNNHARTVGSYKQCQTVGWWASQVLDWVPSKKHQK